MQKVCLLHAGGSKSWASFFQGSKARAPPQHSKLSPEDDPDTIHIFTVASGHMYERLQKIMVLSVLRTTKCALPGIAGLTPRGPSIYTQSILLSCLASANTCYISALLCLSVKAPG